MCACEFINHVILFLPEKIHYTNCRLKKKALKKIFKKLCLEATMMAPKWVQKTEEGFSFLKELALECLIVFQ